MSNPELPPTPEYMHESTGQSNEWRQLLPYPKARIRIHDTRVIVMTAASEGAVRILDDYNVGGGVQNVQAYIVPGAHFLQPDAQAQISLTAGTHSYSTGPELNAELAERLRSVPTVEVEDLYHDGSTILVKHSSLREAVSISTKKSDSEWLVEVSHRKPLTGELQDSGAGLASFAYLTAVTAETCRGMTGGGRRRLFGHTYTFRAGQTADSLEMLRNWREWDIKALQTPEPVSPTTDVVVLTESPQGPRATFMPRGPKELTTAIDFLAGAGEIAFREHLKRRGVDYTVKHALKALGLKTVVGYVAFAAAARYLSTEQAETLELLGREDIKVAAGELQRAEQSPTVAEAQSHLGNTYSFLLGAHQKLISAAEKREGNLFDILGFQGKRSELIKMAAQAALLIAMIDHDRGFASTAEWAGTARKNFGQYVRIQEKSLLGDPRSSYNARGEFNKYLDYLAYLRIRR